MSLSGQVSRVTETALGNVPAEFKVLVRSTLSIDPSVRPDAQQIVKVCGRLVCVWLVRG